MAYIFGSIWDRFNRNALNALSKSVEQQGKSIQDLVAEGQLTPTQYATLIQYVNGLISKGNVSVYDIDKNLGGLDASFFDKEFLEDLSGGNINTTVLNDGSVIRRKIGDGAVTPEKTSFSKTVVTSANLYNYKTVEQNKLLSTTTGEALDNNNYFTTDYIEVESGGKITARSNTRFAEYDRNKVFIKLTANISTLTLTSNTKYIRGSVDNSTSQTGYRISKGSTAINDEYKEETEIINMNVSEDLSEKIKRATSTLSTNLVTNGNFISEDTWRFGANTQYSISGNEVTVTSYDTGAAQVFKTITGLTSGNKYYISLEMKSASAEDGLYIAQTNTFIAGGSAKYENRIISTVETVNATSIGFQALRSTRIRDIPKPTILKNAIMIDLTKTFGEGNEPSREVMDLLVKLNGGYIDGTQPLITNNALLNVATSNINSNSVDNSHINWIAMGDSITEGSNEYPHRANEKLGFTLLNDGFGGASMSMRSNQNESFNPESFVYKAKNRTNWISYDVLTILYGTNDWSNDIEIGTINSTDEYTFMGAMNVGIQKILSENRTIRIYLITPTFRRNTLTNVNDLDLQLQDYVDAVKQIAEKYRLPIIDMWMNAGWNYYNNEALTTDGLHPNNDGQIRMGNIVAHELKELI